jgi:hypothetical protein
MGITLIVYLNVNYVHMNVKLVTCPLLIVHHVKKMVYLGIYRKKITHHILVKYNVQVDFIQNLIIVFANYVIEI